MLTFNDCLGLSELDPEQVAALARHEHLPEIVALEMGWSLCGTPEGKRQIRRMILDDIEAACRKGDTRDAARLGLALHRFLEAHLGRHEPAEPPGRAGRRPDAPTAWHGGVDPLIQVLGLEPETVLRLRERVDACLGLMMHRFGLDRASVQERFPTEMQVAEMCCAACTELGRCRRFLAGTAKGEMPLDFCPNAPLFRDLALP